MAMNVESGKSRKKLSLPPSPPSRAPSFPLVPSYFRASFSPRNGRSCVFAALSFQSRSEHRRSVKVSSHVRPLLAGYWSYARLCSMFSVNAIQIPSTQITSPARMRTCHSFVKRKQRLRGEKRRGNQEKGEIAPRQPSLLVRRVREE